MKEQTPDICMAAVRQNGLALQFVKEQTPDICMAAVRQNAMALQYVKNMTDGIRFELIGRNPEVIQQCDNVPIEIVLRAVKNNGLNLRYVKKQSPEICLAAVKHDGRALQFVKEQTLHICIAAYRNNPASEQYMWPEFIGKCQYYVPHLEPTHFIALPESVDTEQLIDPVSFEVPKKGEACAFLKQGAKYHFAGTLGTINEMIKNAFRGSSEKKVFVPIRNSLISTAKLLWAHI